MIKKKFRKKGKVRSAANKSRQWILSATAVGVLVAYTVGNSRAMNVVYVKNENIEISRIENYNDKDKKIYFDIPAGTLEEVLEAFEKTAGLRAIIPDDVKDIGSPGVVGEFTKEQALAELLENTGVGYSFTSTKTITLKLRGPSEVVQIEDEGSVISSPKYTQPLRDIPQTINVIDKEVIEEQGSTTLRDVLRNVPGITVTAGEGGAPAGDNLTLRGFSARNDIYIDGARDLGPQTRDPFNLEQVEVVKGPSSSTSGRGSTGGTINLVSKTPTFRPFYDFSLSLGTDKTKRVTGDINFPIERLGWGDRTAFRLNFLAHDSKYAGREIVENKRWGIAPTLTLGLGSKSTLNLSYFHLDQNNTSDYGIPWIPATNNVLSEFRNKPAPVPRDTFYGFKDRDFEKLKADLGTITFYHSFNDKVNLRNQFRYGFTKRDSIATPPRFNSNDSTVIKREMRSWLTEDENWDNQTDLTVKYNTGKIEHSIVTGTGFIREKNVRRFRSAPNSLTTLLDPNPFDIYAGEITLSSDVGEVAANTQSFYLFDTAKIHPKFELTGGFRFDRFAAEGNVISRGISSEVSRVDNLLSYRIGAIYKPLPFGSIYASYNTSQNPSLEGLSYNISNSDIDPEKTYTLEAGTKWDLFQNRLLLTGAIFRINKNNARTPGILADDPPEILEGKQRVDGFELSATGFITRNWNILAGYTFLDSEIVESNDPNEIGNRLANTPRNSFNLWSTYQFQNGLSIGGGARFVDERFNNTSNTRFVEGYWLIDAMASYRINKFIDLRLNINNLTDKFYFDRVGGGHIIPGPARNILLATNFHF